ncbi:YbaN family protein [Halomonas sp. LS-001]
MKQLAWCSLAYGCIGLCTAGIVLPLLPTTPFLLLAFRAATKGSPRLAQWLYNHPQFHPYLDAWQTQRAIPGKAKWLTLILLSASWLTLFLMDARPLLLIVLWLFFSAVTAFIFTRPTTNTYTSR